MKHRPTDGKANAFALIVLAALSAAAPVRGGDYDAFAAPSYDAFGPGGGGSVVKAGYHPCDMVGCPCGCLDGGPCTCLDRPVSRKSHGCDCSAACSCGCQEGLPCRCSEARPAPARVTYQSPRPAYLPPPMPAAPPAPAPAPVVRTYFAPAPLVHTYQPPPRPTYRPAYQPVAFRAGRGGRACGPGG
jgi:hypothetical protein